MLSSLSASSPDPTQPFTANEDLQDYLNRCENQMVSLFAKPIPKLESLLTTVQTSNGGLSFRFHEPLHFRRPGDVTRSPGIG
ncbi:hypothetical protein EGR_09776 [Echinococcus granulosus]|uniref:Uncharacterized protein n=1 Tax=Echinococcus granulosus TaxID=6210 RepID=W6U2N1_ECHGR|nr:hypothetical protein EGR_09776 [Echinococcus granulosus]EUB55370.1 hypothetical protein EGR_09776 [Echinococcus granulosus]